MTRRDFLENITTWWELTDFCRDEGCDVCEDIVDEDGLSEEVDNDLADVVQDWGWMDILSRLRGIPTGAGYFRRDGMFDYAEMDDDGDFDTYKQDVLDWMDDGGCWDDDEEEEPEEEPFDEAGEEDLFDETAFLEVLGGGV